MRAIFKQCIIHSKLIFDFIPSEEVGSISSVHFVVGHLEYMYLK